MRVDVHHAIFRFAQSDAVHLHKRALKDMCRDDDDDCELRFIELSVKLT